MTKRPFVLANFAVTWDARVSTRGRTPSDFSSAADKKRLLAIRALGDAVMVGRKTLETDTMTLGLPDAALRKERVKRGQLPLPLRVIVSGSGELDPKLRVFSTEGAPVVVFSKRPTPPKQLKDLVQWRTCDDIAGALHILRTEFGVKKLVCEGGPSLLHSLAEFDAIDSLYFTHCPRLFGGAAAPGITGDASAPFLNQSREFRIASTEVLHGECYVHYRRRR